MNLQRTLYILLTYPNRLRHRLGFGVQSPSDYELVRDVLFERLHYYAYDDQHLTSASDRQLWRLRNRFGADLQVISDDASRLYSQIAGTSTPRTMLVVEGIDDDNAALWNVILHDARATVTFDLADRGLVSFNPKRIKQNYTL